MRSLMQRAGFDPRFSAMVMVLIVTWIMLAFLTDGVFLSPRNLYNLSIQTCVTGIMACGMVYLIVARQIDLSVGSVLAFAGMVIAYSQVHLLPQDTAMGWVLSIAFGLLAGVAIGLFQGWWVAFRSIPAFVVTLAGYLMYRGAAFLVADGRTIAPLNTTYQRLGGGMSGSIGEGASLVLGALACAAVVWRYWSARQSRKRYSAAQPPLWSDVLKAALICTSIAGFVLVMNAYPDPSFKDPAGKTVGMGIAIPVLVLLGVAAVLAFVAGHTRFGRYVFAYGGNPEAALLAGIRTKRLLVQLFVLMGILAALAGMITTARLNSGTSSLGQMAELYVIAAAVIGGTSLSGGIGTIVGAIVGALLIQTLDNGMVLLDVTSAKRQIIVGLVLIVAVWFDTAYNKRSGK